MAEAEITYFFFFFCLYLIFMHANNMFGSYLLTTFPSHVHVLPYTFYVWDTIICSCVLSLFFSYFIVLCIISLSLFADKCRIYRMHVCGPCNIHTNRCLCMCIYVLLVCSDEMDRCRYDFLFINRIK